MKPRNLYFDFLRGIAIIMVVAIHTFEGHGFNSLSGVLAIGLRQMLNTAVPVFLAISGFFIGKKTLETKEQCFDFWRNQIPKVYLPVLVWSIPYLILAIHNGKPMIQSLVLYAICGYSIYYFIAVIIQCYCILPLLQKYTLNTRVGGGILCISIFCVTLISYFGLNKLPLILYAGSALVWLIFFWVGLYLSRSDREYKNGWFVFGMILSFILMMIETYYLYLTTGAGYGIKPSSFLFSLFVILFLFSKNVEMHYNEDRLLNKVIKTIGSISFPIYLVHCHIISLFYLFPPIQSWLVRFLCVMTIVVLITLIIRKILPTKFLRIIGFC